MQGLPWILLALAIGVGAPALGWWLRRREAQILSPGGLRMAETRDTVADWPPTATRLLTGAERLAYRALLGALPDCLVFAQVPIARFLRVPTRHSYGDWLARVGQHQVDLLVCDRATAVLAAVEIRPAQDGGRPLQRHRRLTRVLQAAGVRVAVWQEGVIPGSAQAIRDALLPPELARGPARAPLATTPARPPSPPVAPATPLTRIPVGQVLQPDQPEGDTPPQEPPTTWYSEFDDGAAPTPLPAPAPAPRGR